MIKIIEIFNSRELASIVWILILFIFLMRDLKFIKSVGELFKSMIGLWKIFIAMIIYIIVSIYILYTYSLWNFDLLKVSIYWFFAWALIALLHGFEMNKKEYVKKIIKDIAGLTVIISFITSFYTFPFLIEFLLLPLFTLITVIPILPDIKNNLQVTNFANKMLVFFGLSIFIISLIRVISNFKEFAVLNTLLEFLLPIILSILFLPFIYIINKIFQYQYSRNLRFLRSK